MKFPSPRLAFLLLALPAAATDYTWDGGDADSNWASGNNWNPNGIPVDGDTLTWNGSGGSNTKWSGTNNLAADTDIAGISFINGIGGHSLSGNRIELTGNISNTTSNSTGVQILNFDILLSGATRTLTASPTVALTAGNTHALTFNGGISGDQGLILTGNANGKIMLAGANTYTGSTSIGGGTVTLSGGNNRLPTTTSLGFTGTSTLDIGSTSQDLAGLAGANGVTGNLRGAGGTLTLNSGFTLGGTAASQTQTLDARNLSNFVVNAAGQNINLGGQYTGGGNNAEHGVLYLAGNNTLAAATLRVGPVDLNAFSADQGTSSGTLHLGQANTLNVGTIQTGGAGGGNGTVQFASGLTNPTVTIRGAAGGSSRANITNGRAYDVYSGSTVNFNLGGGTTDAMVGTLIALNGVGAAVSHTGTFTLGAGTLDATTIYVVYDGSGGDSRYQTGNLTGILNLNNGGTTKVTTLHMAHNGGYGVPQATLNLNGGSILNALTLSGMSGTAQGTRAFNWNDGTIRNYDASTSLTISSNFSSFNLLGAGLHAFDISADRQGTVNQALVGAGALTKSGAGTLALTAAANAYSGATLVNAGTFSLTGGLTGGTAITVANDAVFTQSAAGVISGAASFTHNSSATSTLSGVNTYSGLSALNQGSLLVNGALFSAGMVTVSSGATLGGKGSAGNASLADGAVLAPGLPDFSENQIALSSLSLAADSILRFDLDAPNPLANLTPSFYSDHVALGGALVLDGKLRVNPLAGFVPDPASRWILMTYPAGGSNLTDNGLDLDLDHSPGLPAPPAGFVYALDTATDGYVFLALAAPEPGAGALMAAGLLMLRRRLRRRA